MIGIVNAKLKLLYGGLTLFMYMPSSSGNVGVLLFFITMLCPLALSAH